ncbi:class I SAM-dependent methyltransferase [Streptomyces blastmyceticus]|uniref:Class I SAM-dependent methyltransferase n=1 Tax=Streptomyces blastmyceticus TaxID=68180 RepID=A0ABN0WD87_9ACTN
MACPNATRDRTVIGDAFGLAVTQAWRAGGAPGLAHEIIERDDGLLTINDVSKYFEPFSKWGVLEQRSCDRASGRVLDVGCGPGRHALQLHQQGLEVLGVEPSPGVAAVARERGVDVLGLSADDVSPSLGMFDTVLLGGQNIGLLESREKGPDVLNRLAEVTRPGGALLGVGIDPYLFSNPAHLAYLEENRALGRMAGQQRFRIRHGLITSPWNDFLFASVSELEELAAGTPWQLVDTLTEGLQYLAHFVKQGV